MKYRTRTVALSGPGRILVLALMVWNAAAEPGFGQTGEALPAFAGVDSVMQHSLSTYGVKGGAVAVVKDGHLLFARGYGLADVEGQEPVRPQSLFRWCSISKTVTAAAVMRLIEERKLDPDAPVFAILDQFTPYNGSWGDGRLKAITVRQLLHHTGGWDRQRSPIGDPVVAEGAVKAARAAGGGFPPALDTVIRYMLAQPLDFTPGTRFAYSNFGYELLRCVIEKVSGQGYQEYVRQNLLDPAGLLQVQKGSSHLNGRLPDEVKYYDYPGAPMVSSYVSPYREQQPQPYGIMNADLEEASGAWVGSVVDLAKLMSLLDGQRTPGMVTPNGFLSMIERQSSGTWVDSYSWYGFGLFVQEQPDGVSWNHGGYNPGSQTGFYRFPSGLGYAYVFNGASKDGAYPSGYVAQALWNALATVEEWPEHDLFPQYYPPRIAQEGVLNSASMMPGALAPASLVTVLGTDLGGRGADVALWLRDASGVETSVSLLDQTTDRVRGVMPEGVASGGATLVARRANWPDAEVAVPIAPVAPGLFTLNSEKLLAASVVRSPSGDLVPPWMRTAIWEQVYELDESGRFIARPIEFGPPEEELTLVLYGTGVRGRSAAEAVRVVIGELPLTASMAGPQPGWTGMDEIRVILPRTLSGAGTVDVRVEADGVSSNTATLVFR